MPDFDKNLQPIIKKETPFEPEVRVRPNKEFAPMNFPGGTGDSDLSAPQDVFGKLRAAGSNFREKGVFVTNAQLDANRRYSAFNPTVSNQEDYSAYGQSNWDKAANGLLKGANLVGTTIAGGFGMLMGIPGGMLKGRLAEIWDNPVLRNLDKWNEEVDQIYLPNYYTQSEKDAAWYSTNNWLTTNFLFDKLIKNSGFAVGAMLSGNMANAGLIRAGASIGSKLARAATIAESSQAFKLFTPLLRNTARAFSAGKNLEAAAVLEKQATSIGDLTAQAKALEDIGLQTSKFANFGDEGRRIAVSFYSSAGESSFEALQTGKEMRNNLIQKWKDEHGGQAPTGEDLKNINQYVESVGFASFAGNMALLSATEYQQLPFLLGSSYKNTKLAANNLLTATDDVLLRDGKYAAAKVGATTLKGKVYEGIKQTGKKLLTGQSTYAFDPKEAIQEIGQFALQVGVQNYYTKAYQGEEADAWVDGFLYGFVGKNKRGEDVGALVSKEGIEGGILGGITGGLMQAKSNYQLSRAKKTNTQTFIKELNGAPGAREAFIDRKNSVNRGVVLQQEYQDAVVVGDEQEARDLKADMTHNYLATRIKYGRFDMVMDDIADLRREGSTEKGLAALKVSGVANIDDDIESYQQKLNSFEAAAKSTNNIYESLNLRFGGIANPDGSRRYSPTVIDKMAYAATKIDDYNRRIPQLSQELSSTGVDISGLVEDIVINNDPKEETIAKAVSSIASKDVLEKDELKSKFNDLVELAFRKKLFLDEYEDIKANPAKYDVTRFDNELEGENNDESGEIPDEDRPKIKVKTKDGEEELEIGTEYYVGKITEYDKNGREVYRFPKLTIIGENEDGTIKINTENDVVRDISKEALLDYKLGKVRDTQRNKKAKFYMENINTIFEFNFGNGKKARGRLRLSPKQGILEFVYKDDRGKMRAIEVTGDQFVPRKGYDQAMIVPKGQLTATQKRSLDDFATAEDVRSAAKRESRLKILNEMFDEMSNNLKSVNELINSKKAEVDKITSEISELEQKIASGEMTKKNAFKAATRNAIKAANRLSKLRNQLLDEIQALESEKDTIEFNLAYVADMAQNIDELPTDSKEFLEELNEQVLNLTILQEETGKSINEMSALINKVEGALKTAVDLALDLIERFEAKYPGLPVAPIALRQFLNQDLQFKGVWPDYQSYLAANPNLLADLMEFDRELADIDELDVVPNERTVGELRKALQAIQDQLASVEKELAAKSAILDRFEDAAKKYRQQKAEEDKLVGDNNLINSVLGSLSKSQQTLQPSEKYEPEKKKSDIAVVSSTVSAGEERANRFGARLESLPNRENIRGIYVTEVNEAELGLEGFTQRIVDTADPTYPPVEKSKIIALVMVEQNPENAEDFQLIDENGQPIFQEPTLGELTQEALGQPLEQPDPLDAIVYQMMPLEDLEWDDKWSKTPGKKVSMFRSSTDEQVVKSLKEQYKAFRNGVLENPTLERHEIEASFGVPEYVEALNSKGVPERVKDARVPVAQAGLVSPQALNKDAVILVPTVEKSIQLGSTTFNNPQGFPFLITPNGYVKLNNRKLTSQEVENVYNAMTQVAKILYKEGNLQSKEAKRLLRWLKSVVYWGTPQKAKGELKPGYNSIWFEKIKTDDMFSTVRLFMSAKGQSFTFTPTAMQENEQQIKTLLGEMYNNVNATLAMGSAKKGWNEAYEEITSIASDGTITSRIWKNYQTFLLSDKFVGTDPNNAENGKKVDDKSIPLTTQIRPLTGPSDVNRKGIYFTVATTAKGYTIPEIKNTKKASVIKPGVGVITTATVEEAPAEAPTYVFDGKTINTYTSTKSGLKVNFRANIDGEVKITKGEDLAAALKAIEDTGKTTEEAQQLLKSTIVNAIKPQIKDIKNTAAQNTLEAAVGEEEEEDDDKLTEAQMRLFKKQSKNSPDRTPLRQKLRENILKFEGENWSEVEKWLKANFPNIPVYRVKNILKGTNGVEAWGMLQDGAIYLYENAEVGTVYHEVFEAVWKMFTDGKERQAILNEFKNRTGSFVDRPTGETIKYSEATDEQAKEQLAEEFRDYIREGKVPQKPKDGRPFIVKLFSDLWNFIKEFFTGNKAKNNTEELFSRIGTGYYKTYAPYTSQLSMAQVGIQDIEEAFINDGAALRIKDIRGENIGDIIQNMTYVTIKGLTSSNQSLFGIPDMKGKQREELYNELLEETQSAIASVAHQYELDLEEGKLTAKQAADEYKKLMKLWKSVTEQWDEIVKKHQEQLRSYGIEFDENDNIQVKSDEKSKESDWTDARKVDSFKKANSAVKLLLSTIPITKRLSDGRLETISSSIGGVKLLPATEVYMAILNRTKSARNIDEMLEIVRQMAIEDGNYEALYKRLTKSATVTKKANLTTNLSDMHDVQLLTAFWKSFKKQNPDVKNVYILDNGQVVVGDSNFTTAALQTREEYNNAIKEALKGANPYFKYSDEQKAYIGKPEGVKNFQANTAGRVKFLATLGIEFDKNEIDYSLNKKDRNTFEKAVDGIVDSIRDADKIATVGYKVLNIGGRLRQLAEIRTKLDNPEFSSTYFNVNGERVQTFLGTNAASDLHDTLINISNLSELDGTQYEYLRTDTFAQNSVLLKKMFDSETGDRIAGSEKILKTAYADGIVDSTKGRRKEASKVTYKERLILDINMNLEGYYTNLIPGDASIEWLLYLENHVTENTLETDPDQIVNIFKGYFIDEFNLSREDRPIVKGKGRKTTDLRFFKPILGDKLHDKIVKEKGSAETVYTKYKKDIDKAVDDLLTSEVLKTRKLLGDYGIVFGEQDDTGNLTGKYDAPMLAFDENEGVSEEYINDQLYYLSANYAINNIELHKLLYSDPYQYSDELKRIKSFNSPRQPLISNSNDMNSLLDKVWNKGFKTDLGKTKFDRDYFRTVAIEDVIGKSELPGYDEWEETDGGGIISFKAHRNLRIRASNWNPREEAQYRYDIEYERLVKEGASKERMEEFAKKNPQVRSAYTPVKPIVSGNKGDENDYNDVVLDKFALYPLSFRIAHTLNSTSNLVKLYNKMAAEDIDYAVYKSGRKVGATQLNALYVDGQFNNSAFEGVVNVPFAIMSIQSEVPSKEDNMVTRGTQMTKEVTMDLMAAGVPVDFMADESNFNKRYEAWYNLKTEEARKENSNIYKEVVNNQELLEELIDDGYQRLLRYFGIKETIVKGKKAFKIDDFTKVTDTLREEILKREVNDNIIDALNGFEAGDVVLEATPAYQQIRNILYSIADREVVSPKINGGQKVQIPVTLMESEKIKKIDGKYVSDYLKFYKDADGQRVMEIMVGRWFKSPLSDEELMDYFNNTEAGKKQLAALTGVAFRIPTQKLNSIDSFRIAKFLPEEFGDSVVIPSELVKKVGSDFDIDKLSIYLKNVFVTADGLPKLVPFFGYGEQAKTKIKEWLSKQELLTLFDVKREDIEAIDQLDIEEELKRDADEVNRYYTKSLQNAYIESTEKIVSEPANFQRLIKPNSADQMKKLAKEISELLGVPQFDYSSTENMLSRDFMTRLRHAFVRGKYAIGIAAVAQTNHSLNQRTPIIVDYRKLEQGVPDTGYLGDGKIKFPKFNRLEVDGEMFPTLSMIANASGQDISDIIGQFIDGYVDISKGPWIMELGATPNVAGTWLFLIKVGVPVNTVAYFMNQPAIRDYLLMLENAGYSSLYINDFYEKISEKYSQNDAIPEVDELPSEGGLRSMVGKDVKKMNKDERIAQVQVLQEFVKYASMSGQLLLVTQGSNYDTATFNDPYLIFKKKMQEILAQKSLISSVNDLMKKSFVRKLANRIQDTRDAFAQILLSDAPKMRNLMEKVLMPYVTLPDGEFIKISQKAVSDVFDWAVQVDPDKSLNKLIEDTLLSDTKNAAKEINTLVKQARKNAAHPLHNNQVIKLYDPQFSEKKNGVNNLKIKNKDNKVYDQNQLIYAFSEIKTYLKGVGNPQLYEKLVRASVLQSGLSNSPIAFTNLLPYNDFKDVYGKVLAKLENSSAFSLEDFYKLGVLQRNNWTNDDIVPHRRAAWKVNYKGKPKYNSNFTFGPKYDLYKDINSGKTPQVMKLSNLAREAGSDYLVYTWEVGTKNQKAAMKKKGDFSYIKKGLFKKVYDEVGNAFEDVYITPNGNEIVSYIYKAVNAWGDSFRANEFYDKGVKSVIDNGFIKVSEVDDASIRKYFQVEAKPTTPTSPEIKPANKPAIKDKNQKSCG